NAHAHEVVADVRRERTQPVVARVAATALDANLARREIELVVEHDDVADGDLQIALRLAAGASAVVHERLRFEQDDPLPAEAPLADEAMKALAPGRQAVALRHALKRHEADVVAMASIRCARIAQADQQLHGSRARQPPTPAALGGAHFLAFSGAL